MNRIIRILYAAAEISPYANAGGLGEVGRSFPKALAETGDFIVQRVMPLHKSVDRDMEYRSDFPVAMGQGYETCVLKMDPQNKEVPTYFIGNDKFFYRDNIYGYEDDGQRFYFFCRAIVEMLKRIPYQPDILITNDWHTGFLPLLLKYEFPEMKTVYTIHNIAYHGFIPSEYVTAPLSDEERKTLGWPGWLNFMKAGIVYSDLLTTVSKGYCEEIMQPEFGCGMTPLIKQRSNGMIGIVNGIDMGVYDPGKEGELEFPYDRNHLECKRKNKISLFLQYGLSDPEKPLVAMVTRLDYTKGIDTVLNAISYFDFSKFRLLILGTGSPYYQSMLANTAKGYVGSISVVFEYSQELAKNVYAAADIYLMPSLTEPCGIGQLIAMRYGAVPIVHPVGGLKDTVTDDERCEKKHTGFYLKEWNGKALNETLERAIKAYHSPVWVQYTQNCMDYDASWQGSVKEYKKLFMNLLEG